MHDRWNYTELLTTDVPWLSSLSMPRKDFLHSKIHLESHEMDVKEDIASTMQKAKTSREMTGKLSFLILQMALEH